MGKKSFLQEFKAFAMKGNVVDMAVGVIIGGKMVREGTLSEVCGEKNLEDAFFGLYKEVTGE